ncbi:MAG: pyruvate ferredoxin oxidoreductase [Thermoprotei archaeon]|nr:MAG: pyruvate ferredoxin oxidoreductase [Thermoprotei archaeon]
MSYFIEVRWHGRGGQGAVTSAELIVSAAIKDGKYAVAIPFFGAERRGAPVVAYNRISSKPIRTRAAVKNPDVVVVLDPSLAKIIDITQGLKKEGMIVFNGEPPASFIEKNFKIAYVDATDIALRNKLVLAGIALVNMPMLGAFTKATQIFSIDSVVEAVKEKWPGEIGERNATAVLEAYNRTVVKNGK